MGESLYGQGNYSAGNYSQSPYFNLVGSVTHVELTSAPAAMRATLSLVGGATHVQINSGPAPVSLIDMFSGSFSIVLRSVEADWGAEYSLSASARIELGVDSSLAVLVHGLEPSDPTHVLFNASSEVDMYGGPYWVDDAPPEQIWTPISVGGFGG